MIPALFALALLVLVLLVLGHHDEQRIIAEWDMTLNPEGLRAFASVAEEIAGERWLQDQSYEDAARAQVRGDRADAIRFLRLGTTVLDHCSDSLLALLKNLPGLAGRAAAIAPMPPLWPRSFHARSLMTLAGIHQLGHHLLVTTRERFAFRLAVLRYGVVAATRLVYRSTARLTEDLADSDRWHRVDELRGDLGTLSDESLETLRLVLVSLTAVRRPVRVRERETA
jgi:hypothetical protein